MDEKYIYLSISKLVNYKFILLFYAYNCNLFLSVFGSNDYYTYCTNYIFVNKIYFKLENSLFVLISIMVSSYTVSNKVLNNIKIFEFNYNTH